MKKLCLQKKIGTRGTIEKERFELKFKEPFYQEHEIEKEIKIKVDDEYRWINYEEWKAVIDFYEKWGL